MRIAIGKKTPKTSRPAGNSHIVILPMIAACGFAAAAGLWCCCETRAVKWVATAARIISGRATGRTWAWKSPKLKLKVPSDCIPPATASFSRTPKMSALVNDSMSARSKT